MRNKANWRGLVGGSGEAIVQNKANSGVAGMWVAIVRNRPNSSRRAAGGHGLSHEVGEERCKTKQSGSSGFRVLWGGAVPNDRGRCPRTPGILRLSPMAWERAARRSAACWQPRQDLDQAKRNGASGNSPPRRLPLLSCYWTHATNARGLGTASPKGKEVRKNRMSPFSIAGTPDSGYAMDIEVLQFSHGQSRDLHNRWLAGRRRRIGLATFFGQVAGNTLR